MATQYKLITRINDTTAYFEINFIDLKDKNLSYQYAPRPKDVHQMEYAEHCMKNGKPMNVAAEPEPVVEPVPVVIEPEPVIEPVVVEPYVEPVVEPLTENELPVVEVITDNHENDYVDERVKNPRKKGGRQHD